LCLLILRLDHSNIIWYDEENGGWNIGFQVNSTAIIHSPDKVANPKQATSWKYASNGKWIEPIDILVGPGVYSAHCLGKSYYVQSIRALNEQWK
jgi:hypothetical protein